jgi:hypothetical protein
MRSFKAIVAGIWFALGVMISPALASQATVSPVPGSPLPMSSLATYLNAAFLSIGSCNSGNSAPANDNGAAFAGECWWNTTSNPWVLSVTPDGTNWVEIGTLNTSTLVWKPYFGASPVTVSAPITSNLSGGSLSVSCPECFVALHRDLGGM